MDIKNIAFTEEEIRNKMINSPTLRNVYTAATAAEKMKDWNVGMVLVCRRIKDGKLITNSAGVVEKYIIVNKLGPLPICKKLTVNGKIGVGLYCPAVEDGLSYFYEEDPEVADAILLGVDYDPIEYPKKVAKARNNMRNYNRKITLRKYIKNRFNDVSTKTIKNFLNSHINENGVLNMWYMDNEKNKQTCRIKNINSQDRVEIYLGNKVNPIYETLYRLTSTHFNRIYFIKEPKTLSEQLEKIK